jgi:hypothetical protein
MKPLNKWTSADIIGFVKSVDKKTWVASALGTSGFFLALVFLIIPAWIERPLLRRDIQGMEAQIRQVNALNQKRFVWEEDQKIFAELINKTKKRVFTADEIALLLGQVSKKANEFHVDMLASKPVAEKPVFAAPYHLKYEPSGYQFTLQGGYHDLAKLVCRIETHEKLLRIRSIQITPSEKTPDRHIAELTIWAVLPASPPAAALRAPVVGASGAKK